MSSAERLRPSQGCGCTADRYIALFDYSPTRNGDNAVKLLGEYSGDVVCDGFDGYNKLTGVTRCGGHMQGESLLRLYPQIRSLYPHQQLQRV